jgi:CheY-like chemotaxis protein
MKQRILVVDDDATNRKLIHVRLRNTGYEVLEAADGAQAIELCNAHHPDLVLLDVCMPGMTGHEVAAALKRSPGTRDIPVIMLTAMSERPEITRAHENGVIDYVIKPFNAVDLQTNIRRALG